MMFRNREEAGVKLANAVAAATPDNPVILALPRGGVPLAVEVAERLSAPLDLLIVRKIGMPGHAELAAGAVVDGSAPTVFFNSELVRSAGLAEKDFAERVEALRGEIETRRSRYLPGRAAVPVAGKTAIVVDDGIATGATVRAAIRALRAQNPAAVWVAVPVAPTDTAAVLAAEADRLICLEVPEPFFAVGAHYREFGQVPDATVIDLIRGYLSSESK